MKSIIKLTLIFLFATSLSAYGGDCGPFGCIFQIGTVCIDGKCVPINPVVTPSPEPAPTETPMPTIQPPPSLQKIELASQPIGKIDIKEFDCTGINFQNLKIILKRTTPPGSVFYYSTITDNIKSWSVRKSLHEHNDPHQPAFELPDYLSSPGLTRIAGLVS